MSAHGQLRDPADLDRPPEPPLRAELTDPRQPPPGWERFVTAEPLNPAWHAEPLAALAAAGWPLSLGLVSDAGVPVAAFCGRRRGPLLECLLPGLASPPGFAFARGLDRAGRRAAVTAFERALLRYPGGCLGIAYRQASQRDLEVLHRAGRARVGTSPGTRLANRWGTMAEYFATLPRKRRGNVRDLWRKLSADPDLRIRIGPGGVTGEEASRLALLTLRRHHRFAKAPPAGWFDALADRAGTGFLSYRDGASRLLAFSLLLDEDAVIRSSTWGALDPHGDGRPHLYFDHYLRVVEHMIERRLRAADFGKGMVETKQRFGCAVIPQYLVAAVR